MSDSKWAATNFDREVACTLIRTIEESLDDETELAKAFQTYLEKVLEELKEIRRLQG